MQCPKCDVELVMSERQNIEIDYCPRCRGVWLDRGELDKIIDRSLEREVAGRAETATVGDRHAGGHRGHRNHRRKSWLNELFD